MTAQELYQELIKKVATFTSGDKVIELSRQGKSFNFRQVNGGSSRNDVLWFSENILLTRKTESIGIIYFWLRNAQ